MSSVKETYPIVPIRDGLVFPKTEAPLVFGRPKTIKALEAALNKNKQLVLALQRDSRIDNPQPQDLYDIGVLISIERFASLEHGELQVLVRGLSKVKITRYTIEEPYFIGEFEEIPDIEVTDDETKAMVLHLSNELKKAINLGKNIDFIALMNVFSELPSRDFSYQMAAVLDLKPQEKQLKLLEEYDVKKRLKKEVEYLAKEIKILEIERTISSKTQQQFEKGMKENVLREKMRTIEKELGDKEDRDIAEYRKKIRDAHMPKEVEKKALKELERMAKMSQYNPESSYVRTYLDWLVELPWQFASPSDIDIAEAERILNEDHFGLKKIKERILEYLAVMKLRKSTEEKERKEYEEKAEDLHAKKEPHPPTILCFVGPPGVGKTSLGRSIARSLGRKFVKISLGGIRDEAEIRGHRRTYVGALPGRIIQGIKTAGTNNPVFMLDEIDKLGKDFRGDPSSALLEALDPEQNHAFSDHYLEVEFDLSSAMFITTANVLDSIPPALLDRLEVIHFPGYTEDEKYNIAHDYLIKKQQSAHGLSTYRIAIEEDSVRLIIRRYTREAGVRELERQIATLFRKVARDVVARLSEKKGATPLKTIRKLDHDSITKYLGPYKYSSQLAEQEDTIGMSTGLAWTQAGGEILFIEVSTMPGKGTLTITGQLGDVMKESCQAALSYVRARWDKLGLVQNFYEKLDIHIHVPEGAVPKDGPSAGLAITTALISALTKISVRRDVAMTGEVTLRGRALEIGGVKEKIVAAHRAGIKTVILPVDNKKDLVELPEKTVKDLHFIFVKHMDEVLDIALNKKIKQLD